MSLTAPERETVINLSDDTDTASIYTAQRRVITKLKRNPAATLVEEGEHEGTPWARFTMPAKLVSFRKPVERRPMTEDERQAARERLSAARERR